MGVFRPRRYTYRRKLPHMQRNKPLFVSATTRQRWKLPPAARDILLDCIQREHRIRAQFYIAAVMPDHFHVLLDMLPDFGSNAPFGIAEVMSTLKGVSAHAINKLLDRRGAVWEEEFFDHNIRNPGEFNAKFRYILLNPVRSGLVTRPEDYRWLWVPPIGLICGRPGSAGLPKNSLQSPFAP